MLSFICTRPLSSLHYRQRWLTGTEQLFYPIAASFTLTTPCQVTATLVAPTSHMKLQHFRDLAEIASSRVAEVGRTPSAYVSCPDPPLSLPSMAGGEGGGVVSSQPLTPG